MGLSKFSFLQGVVPSFSLKLNGIELSFNYEKDGHVYFLLEVFDISIIKFSTFSELCTIDNDVSCTNTTAIGMLGVTRESTDDGIGTKVQYHLDLRLVNCIFAIVLIALLNMVIPFSSAYVTSIMPIMHMPLAS